MNGPNYDKETGMLFDTNEQKQMSGTKPPRKGGVRTATDMSKVLQLSIFQLNKLVDIFSKVIFDTYVESLPAE